MFLICYVKWLNRILYVGYDLLHHSITLPTVKREYVRMNIPALSFNSFSFVYKTNYILLRLSAAACEFVSANSATCQFHLAHYCQPAHFLIHFDYLTVIKLNTICPCRSLQLF